MATIAQTLFQGASTDKLPVADVYNAPTIDLLSSSVTGVKKVLDNVFTSIRSKGFNLNTLAGMVDINGGSVSLDATAAKSRLNSLLGVNVTSIKDLPASAQLSAVNRLTSLAGISVGSLTTTAGSVIKVANGVNAMDVQGILNGVKAVLGDVGLSDIVDSTAQMAFLGSLMEYSAQWGLTDTIQTIMDKFEAGSTERDYLEYTLTTSFTAACVTGDLDNLTTIINNTGGAKIIASYPTAVSMVLSGFQFQNGVTAADYPTLYPKFLNILATLDTNWDTTTRNGQVINKFDAFASASNDSKTLLSTNAQYWDVILMAPSYPTQNSLAIVKAMYPGIAV